MVTGASSGIGRELAVQAAARGLSVVVVARRATELHALAAAIEKDYGTATRVVATDLSLAAGLGDVIEAVRDLDVGLFVAAAGFGTSGAFLAADLVAEQEMLQVNCLALLSHAHFFAQRFARRGRGGIVLMASLMGFQGTPYAAHYAATNAYVQTLAEALLHELRPRGVDVMASAPGPVHSGFAARAGMRMGFALTPATVSGATLARLGRTDTAWPGLLSKALLLSLALLPRRARARLMGHIMGGRTRDLRPFVGGPGRVDHRQPDVR